MYLYIFTYNFDNFESITHKDASGLNTFEEKEDIQVQIEGIFSLCKKLKQFRDDYKELIDLTLIYLDTMDGKEISFKYPGALHCARWMAKLLYTLKLTLLGDTIESEPQNNLFLKENNVNL